MAIEHLRVRAFDAYQSAQQFLLSQQGPGWAVEPLKPFCPWTTAQVLFSLRDHLDHPRVIEALEWLAGSQARDGSWSSIVFSPDGGGDTPATAMAVVTLLEAGSFAEQAEKGIAWLSRTFRKGGWKTRPEADSDEMRRYSTSMSLRALARAPKGNPISSYIAEAMGRLQNEKKGAGWSYDNNTPADATFTCYVLHGLLDAVRLGGRPIDASVIRSAVQWLNDNQSRDGYWSDWHGVETSPEATGYSLYVLFTAGISPATTYSTKALEWLVSSQHPGGGWTMKGSKRSADSPNNWVTHSVLLGLRAFLASAASLSPSKQYPIADYTNIGEMARIKDCDSLQAKPVVFFDRVRLLGEKAEHTSDVGDYHLRLETPIDIPLTGPLDHTMFDALKGYVEVKIPVDALTEMMRSEHADVEVHGIHAPHLVEYASRLGWSALKLIEPPHRKTPGNFNSIRPEFFRAIRASDGRPVFVCAVTPGRDYLLHYATMVRQAMTKLTYREPKVFRYPHAETALLSWTGLPPAMIRRGDIVILGHVLNVKAVLEAAGHPIESELDSEFYRSYRFVVRGRAVNLLGVRYSYWGSTSAVLTYGLCRLGAVEIVYLAKLGCLTAPGDIYSKEFCPSSFFTMNHSQVVQDVSPIPANGLLQWNPDLDTGAHVSVPTVLEEDYLQREAMGSRRPSSIDNEISQMAGAISAFNVRRGRGAGDPHVRFSALHFATDYVRRSVDRSTDTSHDLARNRTPEAKARKEKILTQLSERLVNYLSR